MPDHFLVVKKSSLITVFIAITFICHAQKPQFGIFAGPQTSSAKYSIEGAEQPTEYKYGFQAGLSMKVPFESHLYFSPAAFYSLKGYKVQFNQYVYPPGLTVTDNNTTIHCFELAFLLQYDLSKQPDHFFIKLGPTLDFQLKGKEEFHLMNGDAVSQDMLYDFGAYGRYGANMLLHLGYETRSGLMIFGQYTHGLANINNADLGPSIKHRVYGISIGKYFNKKVK
ncbi:MAG TPA: porin family protein [Chitinophagaceae bacterium]